MNLIAKNIKVGFVVALIALLTGCKDFLDINVNPTVPSKSPENQVLAYAELSMTNALGFGSYGLSQPTSCYMHQIVMRGDFNDYYVTGKDQNVESPWQQLYSVSLEDITQLINNATTNGNFVYAGIGKLLKAYSLSMLVDCWGNVPSSDALKGASALYPKYDSGEEVYASLFALIDEGVSDLDKTTVLKPGSDDLFYGGDLAKWKKFANSLKLKLYNQVRLTSLYNATEVAQLLGSTTLMSTNAEGFSMQYGASNSPNNQHPAFKQEYTQKSPQYYISPYFQKILKADSTFNKVLSFISDPRLPYYIYNQLKPAGTPQNTPAFKDGQFVSIWFASYNLDPNEGKDQNISQTVIGLYPAGGKFDDGKGGAVDTKSGLQGAGMQRLYPSFAHFFTAAELALTMGAPGNAKDYFTSGIKSAFEEVNIAAKAAGVAVISSTDIDNYVAKVLAKYEGGSNDKKLELILTEKWIASFGFGVDMWTDYRRTGYPKLFDPATDNNKYTVTNRDFITILPYPTVELQKDTKAPEQHTISVDKVFWDKN